MGLFDHWIGSEASSHSNKEIFLQKAFLLISVFQISVDYQKVKIIWMWNMNEIILFSINNCITEYNCVLIIIVHQKQRL